MASRYSSRRALTKAHFEAIGFVAAQWSDLEFGLMSVLGHMLDIPVQAAIALGGALGSAKGVSNAIVRLTHELDAWSDIASSVEDLMGNIEDIQTERNIIVHGTWSPPFLVDNAGNRLTIRKQRQAWGLGFPKQGKKSSRAFKMSALEMRDVAHASHEATVVLDHLIYRKPGPSPATPKLQLVLARRAQRNQPRPASPPKSSRGKDQAGPKP